MSRERSTVFYAFVVFRVFVVKEKLHRVPLQDVSYVRATQRCGSVTSKSLGVGEFTRYRPLLVLPFATRPLRIASFSLSLSFRYLYFLPPTFFHLYISFSLSLFSFSSFSLFLSLSIFLSHTHTYIHSFFISPSTPFFSIYSVLAFMSHTRTHARMRASERACVCCTHKNIHLLPSFSSLRCHIHATRTTFSTNLRVAFLPRVDD